MNCSECGEWIETNEPVYGNDGEYLCLKCLKARVSDVK